MDFGIQGKRAVVFGASSGLGYAAAKALKDEGARVVISARPSERLQKAADDLGAELALGADLMNPAAGREVVERAIEVLGGVDILMTNAGGPPKGNFDQLSSTQWKQGFQSLFIASQEAIQAALPGMKERNWGRVLLLTSAAAKEPISPLTISNSLRAGLLGMTNSLSREVAQNGVTVNAILPGFTKTERLAELGLSDEELSKDIPAKTIGNPRRVWRTCCLSCF